MTKLNFLTNSRITLFIGDKESYTIRPDQIPSLIIDALANAVRNNTIISCSIFCREEYENYAQVLLSLWDGVTVCQQCAKVFGDGSYEFIKDGDGRTIWKIM